jgi:hypothetical protein
MGGRYAQPSRGHQRTDGPDPSVGGPPGRWAESAYRPTVDFELPPADDPRRLAVRAWLDDHPSPSGRELAERGLVAPTGRAPGDSTPTRSTSS